MALWSLALIATRTSGVVCYASSFLRLHTHRYRRRGDWLFELGDVRTSFVMPGEATQGKA
jgi:hypothetical protein